MHEDKYLYLWEQVVWSNQIKIEVSGHSDLVSLEKKKKHDVEILKQLLNNGMHQYRYYYWVWGHTILLYLYQYRYHEAIIKMWKQIFLIFHLKF